MKTYEVTIRTRKNSRFLPDRYIGGYVITANNSKSARDFAYELYSDNETAPLSRECLKITAESF